MNPVVESALIAAAATFVGVGGTVTVAIAAARNARRTNQATIDAAHADAQLTLDAARETQLADRYSRALEQVGSASPDVRIGGIYALEAIALDSPRHHPTVMEVLTAFIRQHSRAPADGAKPTQRPLPDIQAALAVVMRRKAEHDIRRIDLSNADLTGATLTGATLPGADLTDATLVDAKFFDAHLDLALLTGADLTRAYVRGAYLRSAHLDGANLTGAHLDGAHLTSANLTSANLTSADLTGADLRGANLDGANLAGTTLTGADLTGAHLRGADFTGANLSATRSLADLIGFGVSRELPGANLTDADLRGADLTSANLDGANLRGADLTDADLTGADLTGADLTGANPSVPRGLADLIGADLGGADFADATLTGAKWPATEPVPEGWELDGESGQLKRAGRLSAWSPWGVVAFARESDHCCHTVPWRNDSLGQR